MEIDAARVKKKPSRLAKLFQKALEKICYFLPRKGGTVAAPADPIPPLVDRIAASTTAAAIEQMQATLCVASSGLQETLERELSAPTTALSPLPSDGYSVSYRITENVSVGSSIPRFSQLSYFLRDGIMTAEEVPERQGFSVREEALTEAMGAWEVAASRMIEPESVRSQAADAIIEAMRARASMPTPPLLPPPPPYVEKPDLDGKREIRLEEEEQS